MQEVSGELLSATPEIKEEAVTHLTEKKVEKSAAEVKADAEEAAEKVGLDATEAELDQLSKKAFDLDRASEEEGASDASGTAADQANQEYEDAVKKFAKAMQARNAIKQEAEDAAENQGTSLLEEDNEAGEADEEDDEAEEDDEDNEADEDMDNEEDDEE